MTITSETAVNREVLEMWAETVIDGKRYDAVDRILARYESVDPLMPSPDELSDIGFDIVGLAKALDAGLDPKLFGEAYALLDISEFNSVLVLCGAGLDATEYNGRLADLVERGAAELECA